MSEIELAIAGMTCVNCVAKVTKALKSVAGVNQVRVDLQGGRATVSGDLPAGDALVTAVKGAGYDAWLSGNGPYRATAESKTSASGCGSSSTVGGGGCCCHKGP